MDASKMTSDSKLASNIRHLRKQLQLSQEDLANKLNLNKGDAASDSSKKLNRGNIASYENGTAEPKICNLLNLAHFYKVSVIDLTSSDLQCSIALGTARNNYKYKLKEEDKAVLKKFTEQAAELEKVMESVRVCHDFKLKSIEKMPPGLQCVVSNFNQLGDAGKALMKAHNDLLEFVRSRVK